MNDEGKIADRTFKEADFIDEIAELLPAEQRPLWYRDMAHLRRLPAEDELLRIARAMGFLALITRQAPVAIAQEREKLMAALEHAISSTNAARQDTIRFHREVEKRLATMPQEIAEGMNPAAVAAILAESLRQQFAQSGLPETAQALAIIGKTTAQTATEFDRSSRQLLNDWRNTSKRFSDAFADMREMIDDTTEAAREAAQALTKTFLREYRWSVLMLCASALMLGFSLGIIWHRWISSPEPNRSANIPAVSQSSVVEPHPSHSIQQEHKLHPPRPRHETAQ
jgi:hypothetical protein